MTTNTAFNVAGTHPAERIFNAQARSSDVYLHGEEPPTANQVAAVLHALADFTLNQHMLSEDVASLGADRKEDFGDSWARATGLGRWFHALGDHLETFPE